MKTTGQMMVCKREGGVEPFDPEKLRRCLVAAMRSCCSDERYADALARAVALHLNDWSEPRPPTTDYIFRCVRTALIETGMEPVARILVSHRRRRAAQRRHLSVCDPSESQFVLTPWRKAAVAANLEGSCGLGHSVARIIAGEVERRVLALEYTVVSTALIAELTRNELLAWGLADAVPDVAPAALGVNLTIDRQPEKDQ